MKYAALLRGINVGKARRIDMKDLIALFERAGFSNVTTYINSGNIFFESMKAAADIRKEVEANLLSEFGFNVPSLVKTVNELRRIVDKIPIEWQNNSEQRTDVAYLFEEVDSPGILAELPLRKEYIDVRYTSGALFWNVSRENYNKSHLNKLISHELYRFMTIRNINTARYIAGR